MDFCEWCALFKFLDLLLLLHAKYHIFNRSSSETCEITTIMYHDTFEWYIPCMATLRGVIYSRSVTVILEYVDLLRRIGSPVFAAKSCLSCLRFIVTSIVFSLQHNGATITPNKGLLV